MRNSISKQVHRHLKNKLVNKLRIKNTKILKKIKANIFFKRFKKLNKKIAFIKKNILKDKNYININKNSLKIYNSNLLKIFLKKLIFLKKKQKIKFKLNRTKKILVSKKNNNKAKKKALNKIKISQKRVKARKLVKKAYKKILSAIFTKNITSKQISYNIFKLTKYLLLKKPKFLKNKTIFFLKKVYYFFKRKQNLSTKKDFSFQNKAIFLFFKIKKNLKKNKIQKKLYLNLLKSIIIKNKAAKIYNKKKLRIYKSIAKANLKHIKTAKKNKTLNIYNKLIGVFLKEGKKSKAIKIIVQGCQDASLNFKKSPREILNILFKNLKTSVELKKIRVRRTFHLVPFPINLKRKIYLCAKWLLLSVKKYVRKDSTYGLTAELKNMLLTGYASAMQYKNSNIQKSLKNRSNLHFRW